MRVTGNGFLLCPVCGGKTRVKVSEETVLRKFPLYCPKCRIVKVIDFGPLFLQKNGDKTNR